MMLDLLLVVTFLEVTSIEQLRRSPLPQVQNEFFAVVITLMLFIRDDVAGDESVHLAPIIDDITHLRVSPIKDR